MPRRKGGGTAQKAVMENTPEKSKTPKQKETVVKKPQTFPSRLQWKMAHLRMPTTSTPKLDLKSRTVTRRDIDTAFGFDDSCNSEKEANYSTVISPIAPSASPKGIIPAVWKVNPLTLRNVEFDPLPHRTVSTLKGAYESKRPLRVRKPYAEVNESTSKIEKEESTAKESKGVSSRLRTLRSENKEPETEPQAGTSRFDFEICGEPAIEDKKTKKDFKKIEKDAKKVEKDAKQVEKEAKKVEKDAKKLENEAKKVEKEAKKVEKYAKIVENDAKQIEKQVKTQPKLRLPRTRSKAKVQEAEVESVPKKSIDIGIRKLATESEITKTTETSETLDVKITKDTEVKKSKVNSRRPTTRSKKTKVESGSKELKESAKEKPTDQKRMKRPLHLEDIHDDEDGLSPFSALLGRYNHEEKEEGELHVDPKKIKRTYGSIKRVRIKASEDREMEMDDDFFLPSLTPALTSESKTSQKVRPREKHVKKRVKKQKDEDLDEATKKWLEEKNREFEDVLKVPLVIEKSFSD